MIQNIVKHYCFRMEQIMRIGTNIAAYIAGGQLSGVEKKLSSSMNRLSSGYKINTSKDDPAGMAMTQKLRTQIRALKRSSMNGSDGISVTQTAESAVSEIEAMLQRMRELAVQGSDDSYTDEDRKNIQSEVSQLTQEINRISTDTQFNNTNLLDGTFQRRTYAYDDNERLTTDIAVTTLSDNVPAGTYKLTVTGGEIDLSDDKIQEQFGSNAIAQRDGNKVKITSSDGFEMTFAVKSEDITDQDFTFDVEDIGTMPIQIGGNEGQQINIIIPCVNAESLAIDDIDMTTTTSCGKAISKLDKAISYASKVRSSLGAYQNRLESATGTLDNTGENLTSALARISDTDMAEEMTNYTTYNVLQQAGVSMLSQANQLPEKVLQLLQ